MNSMRGGRYRWRTWLRERLPVVLSDLVPKGHSDCGAHEWYRADADTWRCYHCRPAIAHSSPWTREEQLQHTLGGINSTLRLLAHADGTEDELQLAELRRLVGEALAALPEEARRLERLASTPVEELSQLAQALRAA